VKCYFHHNFKKKNWVFSKFFVERNHSVINFMKKIIPTQFTIWDKRRNYQSLQNLLVAAKFLVVDCFCSQLQAHILEQMVIYLNKRKEVFSILGSSTKKSSLIFFTGVMVWDIRRDLYNLFYIFFPNLIS
jgi:transposase